MITLGITGSIAMGKSEAAKIFVKNDVPVFDSDACVHNLFFTNQKLKKQIGDVFPDAIEGNQINRAKLGSIVFGSKEKTKKLEALIHPLVRREQDQFLKEHAAAKTPLVVFDIPLLFETGAEQRLDKTLLISAPKEIQKQRVLVRDGMSEEKFEAILSRQMPDEQKQKLANYVISSANGKEAMQKDIESLIKQLSNN